jgi:hypothetical protein
VKGFGDTKSIYRYLYKKKSEDILIFLLLIRSVESVCVLKVQFHENSP